MGTDFDITVSVGKCPDFIYHIMSADEMAGALKGNLAIYLRSHLSNSTKDNSALYTKNDEEKLNQLKSKITVTVENKDDTLESTMLNVLIMFNSNKAQEFIQ